ncbi:MAG TPA: GAF domain-containing protein, partial [Ktedonobacterales bacterium]|nr:GAF domain-containing protein [Ktedonobacterales bacterium]
MTSDRKQHNDQRATPPLPDDQDPPPAATLVGADATPGVSPPDDPQHDPDLERFTRDDRDIETLRALAALTEVALPHRSLEPLLPELAACVRAQLRADAAMILLVDDNTGELVVRAAHGLDASAIGGRIPADDGLAGRIAAQRAPLAVEDLWAYPASHLLRRARLRSALGAPLLDGDRVLGVVQVGSAALRQFSETEIRLLEQLASRMAQSVAYAQALDAAEAAEAARQSAERRAAFLDTTLEALGDGLIVTDAEGRILYGNPAFSALLGATPNDVVDFIGDSPASDAVAERLRQLDVRDAQGNPLHTEQLAIARALRGDTLSGPNRLEIQIRRLDGQQAFLGITGAPVRDASGALIGSVITARDVTQRRRLEDALRQGAHELEAANIRLSTLVEVLPVGVAIVDASGKPMLVNEGIRRVWGQRLPMADSAAQYGEYRGWRTDTGEPVAADQWGLARALSRGAVTVGEEYDIETFDGQRKTILDSAAPLRDASGAITGAVSVILDISEQKRRTERIRATLDAYVALTQALAETPDGEEIQRGDNDAVGAPGAREAAAGRFAGESPLARRLAELARGILGCSRVAVSAVDEVDGRLFDRPIAIVGMTPELERRWWDEQPASQTHEVGTGMLPEDRERLIAGEVFTADLTRPPYESPNAYGVTALLGVAMRTQGRMVGLLMLDFEDPGGQPHAFTPEEIQIAEAVARLGAVALERDRLLRERETARAEALAMAEANRR